MYSLPFALFTQITFVILFRIFYRDPLSKLIRKYFFAAALLIMISQGNLEQFTFYAFYEFKTFFSLSFQHKIVNIFILIFYFLITFICFGLILWLRFHYQKRVKYFLENSKIQITGLTSGLIDQGIIFFLSGVIHQTALSVPNLQLLLNILLEFGWVLIRFIFLLKKIYKCSSLVWVQIISSFLRISLIATFYFYNSYVLLGFFVNQIQIGIIMLLICSWILEFLVGLIVSGR